MALGDLIQIKEIPAGLSSVGTFDNAPTTGNLLIFAANNSLSFASVTTPPAGFTALTSYDGNWKNFWYYKISDGTETTAQLDWSHSGGYGHYLELEWQKGTPVSVQTTEDETNVGAANPGPQTTGSLTPDGSTNLCVGQVTASVANLANNGQVWTGLSSVAAIPNQSNPGTSIAVAADQSGATSGSLDWTDGSPGSYGALAVFNYTEAAATLEDVVINFHGGTPASVSGKTINNYQGATAGQILSNLLGYDTGADQGFAATVSAAIVASTGGRAVGATALDQAIFPEGGYVSDPPIPSNYNITLDVPANVTSVDLGIYSATTFGSQVNVDFSANGVSVTGHSSTDNTDGTVVLLAGVVPNGSNQIVIEYTGNSSQFIFNNGLRIFNIVTSGGGGGAQLASDLSASGTLGALLTLPADTLQADLFASGTLTAALTLPADTLAADLVASGTLAANLAGPFTPAISDTFDGSGALGPHWQAFNAAAIPGVERVSGYLEGDILDNTSDVTTWLDALRGRLEYQDGKVPASSFEEYILTDVGVGPVGSPRDNLPYTSQLAFAGIVVHHYTLGSPGVAADANYEFLVVGHRGGSQQATLEWKATTAGVSSVGHEGANTLGTNVTHADIAVEIHSNGEALFKYRSAGTSDPWTYINGGSGRTFAPIDWGAPGSLFRIGIIGYTLGSSAVPFTYSVDAFTAPSIPLIANLSGTGTLGANLTLPADTLQADLSAVGAVTANLTLPADPLAADLVASGTITAALTIPTDTFSAGLVATGTLGALLTLPADTLQADLSASGTITADLTLGDTLSADLSGTGTLVAALTVPADTLAADLSASGTLGALLTLPTDTLAADLSASGTITANLTLPADLLAADLSASGTLTARLTIPVLVSGWEIELQGALYDVLSNATDISDLGAQVYDDVPEQDSTFPYVTIGEALHNEWDTDTELGIDATVTIHVWSRYRGRKETKQLQDAIYRALHRAEFAVGNYNLVTCDFNSSETLVETDGKTRHGVQVFRVLLDDAA